MKAKKIIKGVAKTTGKYSLKALGKGVELAGRGTIKTVHAIAKNRSVQKIVTSVGMLTAGVMIPSVGVALIGGTALKYIGDNTILGKNKNILQEINDIVNIGNEVTKSASKNILRPTLRSMDKGVKNLGKKYQTKIDDLFR